ncbi:MAG: hypothetical protein ACREAC_21325, partial [Blastocatellia bacterium]
YQLNTLSIVAPCPTSPAIPDSLLLGQPLLGFIQVSAQYFEHRCSVLPILANQNEAPPDLINRRGFTC